MKHVVNASSFTVNLAPANEINRWLSQRHYLHRPIIRSKLVGYSVDVDEKRVGAVLWATPHFTKKRGVFGYLGLPDKWEVLMLARFYLSPESGLIASSVLAKSIGKNGRRLQTDWVKAHPPRFPENPFVPRLLISWSDAGLDPVKCDVCGEHHTGNHQGTIYAAGGWRHFDTSKSGGRRSGTQNQMGEKKLWLRDLPANRRAQAIGLSLATIQETGSLF